MIRTPISTLNNKVISPASLLLFLKIPLFCISLSAIPITRMINLAEKYESLLAEVSLYYEIFLDNTFSFQTETQYQLLTVTEVTLGHPTV